MYAYKVTTHTRKEQKKMKDEVEEGEVDVAAIIDEYIANLDDFSDDVSDVIYDVDLSRDFFESE